MYTPKSSVKRRLTYPTTPRKRQVMDKSAVQKIAKKVILRAAETKSSLSNFGLNNIDSQWGVANLSFPIGQGDTAEDVIGEKIFLKNIRMRCDFTTQNNNVGQTTVFRAIVFRSKNTITTGTAALVPVTTQLMRAPITGSISAQQVDLHKVDLLYDQTFTLTPDVANAQVMRHHWDFNLPINRTHYFDTDNSGILKDKQYYFAFVAQNGGIPSPGILEASVAVNFKDM